MRRIRSILTAGLLLALLATSADAQTPSCDKLTGYQKILATELLTGEHPYDCCSDTIDNCLKQEPTCSLAFRLSETICRRVDKGQPKDAIVTALQQRARSMSQAVSKARIDLTGLAAAGDATAPITVVEYACPRCPYCAMITPMTYDAVTKGRLKGKVKLYLKTFPIRGHKYVRESGAGFLAAQKLGHFWEFVLHFYQRFDLFSVSNQLAWAEAVGMDRGDFKRAMDDPAIQISLVEIKREGIVNDVNATPTFFINGRKYQGALDHEELIDVLEEEFERINGIRYRGTQGGGDASLAAPTAENADAQKAPKTVTRAEARKLISDNAGNPDFVILDIRTASEFERGHLPNAVNMFDFGSVTSERDLEKLDKDKTYLIYCRTGNLSVRALRLLNAMGIKRVYDLGGGIDGWTQAGLEVVTE